MNSRIISEEMLHDFEAHLFNNEKSIQTIKKYLHDIKYFAGYADGREVDKSMVILYKASLEESYALSSANSMIAAVNAFFRFLGWEDCCVRQFRIQKNVYCSEEKELTREEYFKLVKTAEKKGNKRLGLILQTICGTGMRVSELQYITVEAVRKGEVSVSCKNKTRTIFIVRDLQKKLQKYIAEKDIESGYVFMTRSGKPIDRSNIWKEMKALCEEAGIIADKVFPHNLRHLFARVFYNIEKDIAKLADILGHTSINTTRIYIITTGSEHRKKLESMHLII